METSVIENALLVTPRALVFGISGHAQATISMFFVRSQHVAFIQRYANRIDVMITVPGDIHLCFVFISVGFVGVLKAAQKYN
jgi:hypothetical protein